jgi:hypothetical protein
VASTSNGSINDVLVSLSGGFLNPLRLVPPGTSTFGGIACGAPGSCVAVGRGTSKAGERVAQTAVVLNVQAGAPKKLTHLAGSGTVTLQSVSCPSSTFCEAVGTKDADGTAQGGVFMAVNSGLPGSIGATPKGQTLQLNGISCPTTSTCQVVGDNPSKQTAEVLTLTTGG